MLTLAQMIQFVTTKVGQFDATSLVLCKGYIIARYQMVFDAYLWRDAQITRRVTEADLTGFGIFPLPQDMERIVTIRLEPDKFLDPITETFLMESDASALEGTGEPRYYSEVDGSVKLYPAPLYEAPPYPPPPRPPPDPNPEHRHPLPPIRPPPFPPPPVGFMLYLFGKRICPSLVEDTDVSILRNCDNAIMAFAMGDMLERARQYGKAQAKFQEAKELLEEAKSVERDQANQPRRSKNLTVAGNSLSEMTDAVCAICGQWTPDMRILVRDFLRRNYLALYDICIWPESTVAVRVPSIGEQVILPEYVDRVIAVRGADKFPLFPAEISLFFNVNPSVFEQTGNPISFSMLTPCAVAILPPSAPEKLVLAINDISDGSKKVFVRGESHGREIEEEVTLPPQVGSVNTLNTYDVPLTIAKPITKGSVTINGFTSTASLEILGPNEREKKHPRIWILPIPTANQTVLVLAKRKIKPLLTDEDTPIITGCQNVLISGAAADLFAKLQNNEQAKAQRAKADAAAKVLISLNTEQNAYAPQFIPAVEPYAYATEEWCCK